MAATESLLPVIWHRAYEVDIGPHVFPTQKYRLIVERLVEKRSIRRDDLLTPEPAADADVALVHTAEYVGKIKSGGLSAQEQLVLEVPFSLQLQEAMWLCAGGSTLSARLALEKRVAVHLGGGFHHAFPDHGEGFCLINNIAWMLRRFPVFGVFGDGQYRLQPIYVDDLAALAVREGAGTDDVIVQAIGPETFTYRELVQTIGKVIGRPRPVVSVPPSVGYWVGRVFGAVKGDVVITREEIRGLMEGRLYVDAPPAGSTPLTEWARRHSATLGAHYANELARRGRTGQLNTHAPGGRGRSQGSH